MERWPVVGLVTASFGEESLIKSSRKWVIISLTVLSHHRTYRSVYGGSFQSSCRGCRQCHLCSIIQTVVKFHFNFLSLIVRTSPSWLQFSTDYWDILCFLSMFGPSRFYLYYGFCWLLTDQPCIAAWVVNSENTSSTFSQISPGKNENFHLIYLLYLLREVRIVLDFGLCCNLVHP